MGSGAQLHVIGIYQAALGTDGTRSVQVRVTRAGSSVLVLSAYTATTWNVTVGSGARVERIIVNGYHAQKVSAPAGVPVELHSYDQTRDYVGPFAHEWPTYDATQLVNASEDLVERNLSSFRGCYEAASFEIGEPGTLRPENTVSTASEPVVPRGCEHLTTESAYCMTFNYNTPTVVGLDSGRTCAGVPAKIFDLYDISSLAWNGNYLYGCIYDRGLARISLVDGSVDIAPIACQAVTSYRNGLITLLDYDGSNHSVLNTLVQFDTFRNAARHVTSCTLNNRPHASRMATGGDRGYFAWHSTDSIETFALNRNESPQTIKLQGYNGWIMGMDATEDGRLHIVGTNPELLSFNSTTGAALGKKPLPFSPTGLICKTRSGTALP
ncbi:hypothetical protein F0U60_38695 [Archangium minus]|uniref:Uncharacterized protein n=1 Tax=Archangium minus TaxID=83450 RepID=A0ABY9X227_9BACT|nr:hypothetical protein F0U60_38695 [Archangium minus]